MTHKQKKYFGTDGVRGRVGQSLINPEFVMKLGWALGKVIVNGHRRKVLIGKDTRVSGYLLESALEAGLSAAGVDIVLLGPMPTPAIAYLTRTLRASAGIVISASHNLYYDNGIKFFSAEGSKLGDDLELAIEQQIVLPMTIVDSDKLGKATRINDAAGRYIEFCKSTISSSIRLNGIKIVVDCANGATYHIAPHVFRELGAEVIEMATTPDGFNINANCGSTQPLLLQNRVKAESAQLGIAFDGDGDRVIMVDEYGELLDGDELLYIIAKKYQKNNRLKDGGVIGTFMSNIGLEKALQQLEIPFARSKIGDRYVLEQLNQRNWVLGGEASGHILCLDKASTGDGIVASLQVLAAMFEANESLHALKSGLNKFPQVNINVSTTNGAAIANSDAVQKAIKQLEKKLNGSGRILLRPSGTEPVVRVMVEGDDLFKIEKYAQELSEIVQQGAELV